MFCESHPVVKSDTLRILCEDSTKEGLHKDKTGSALIAFWDVENI